MQNKVLLPHHDDKRFIILNTATQIFSNITFYHTNLAINKQIAVSLLNQITNGFNQCEFDMELVHSIVLHREPE